MSFSIGVIQAYLLKFLKLAWIYFYVAIRTWEISMMSRGACAKTNWLACSDQRFASQLLASPFDETGCNVLKLGSSHCCNGRRRQVVYTHFASSLLLVQSNLKEWGNANVRTSGWRNRSLKNDRKKNICLTGCHGYLHVVNLRLRC